MTPTSEDADGLSGGHADQIVTFTFDGVQYSLPLDGNAGKLRGLMQAWLDSDQEDKT